jgi:hypothetical protein
MLVHDGMNGNPDSKSPALESPGDSQSRLRNLALKRDADLMWLPARCDRLCHGMDAQQRVGFKWPLILDVADAGDFQENHQSVATLPRSVFGIWDLRFGISSFDLVVAAGHVSRLPLHSSAGVAWAGGGQTGWGIASLGHASRQEPPTSVDEFAIFAACCFLPLAGGWGHG